MFRILYDAQRNVLASSSAPERIFPRFPVLSLLHSINPKFLFHGIEKFSVLYSSTQRKCTWYKCGGCMFHSKKDWPANWDIRILTRIFAQGYEHGETPLTPVQLLRCFMFIANMYEHFSSFHRSAFCLIDLDTFFSGNSFVTYLLRGAHLW